MYRYLLTVVVVGEARRTKEGVVSSDGEVVVMVAAVFLFLFSLFFSFLSIWFLSMCGFFPPLDRRWLLGDARLRVEEGVGEWSSSTVYFVFLLRGVGVFTGGDTTNAGVDWCRCRMRVVRVTEEEEEKEEEDDDRVERCCCASAFFSAELAGVSFSSFLCTRDREEEEDCSNFTCWRKFPLIFFNCAFSVSLDSPLRL
jgi:hypothetical protein